MSDRYVVLQWRNTPKDPRWKLSRSTVCSSMGTAKRLRTLNQRFPNVRTTIVAEAMLEGLGEISEPVTREERRRKVLSDNLDKIKVRTRTQ